ncbi:TIP-1 family-domain-containing protein [Kockovaella imperatae]|uniref:TIP-1 family-domain-containing protein n=1 Tax=Kockovaella imperatae TaxID=4999 RepID=A0A1Y1UPA9_9TREE|nr:TIP-1 family-domain-containing protein [Kockovaella imperatae]ORX39873.1 TIP-1 family-domain-containing protein [Kockovaella imperatae]
MESVDRIRRASRTIDLEAIDHNVKKHIDAQFPSLDSLLAQHGQSQAEAGPSQPMKRTDSRRSAKDRHKRGLEDEISYWQAKKRAADAELATTTSTLPDMLHAAQERLQKLLESAQSLSIQRYALADKLGNLIAELQSSAETDGSSREEDNRSGNRKQSVLEQMESMSSELARLEAGLAWATILEQVVVMSEQILSPQTHHPSPLGALPIYQKLDSLVQRMEEILPPDMGLLRIIVQTRDTTWNALKDIMSQDLLKACEALKWPLRVDYASVSPAERRAFERSYQDLLVLQAEGEAMGRLPVLSPHWSSGTGLYPLQAMIQPIALRFKYHFQGSRNTNRVDKPEWAFSNILDQIYEHQSFLEDYLQPLTARAGFPDVDVKSEFTMLLFPILLGMLRSRIPKLLDHPALLAHTIYQTVVFDDSIREGGFDLEAVSLHEKSKTIPSWEGLAGVLLKDEGWFQQWLNGEKKFAESQLKEILASPEAWTITDEVAEEDVEQVEAGMRPTTSARQVKALFEQITDRYAPLPSLDYRLPFLTTIQLPILVSYHSRIAGSLDAFETLSSAFARVVPGALSGNTRAGVHIEPAKLTGGSNGLDRLCKAYVSAAWVLNALRVWADDSFFVEMSGELKDSVHLRWKLHNDQYLPAEFKSSASVSHIGASIFDTVLDKLASTQQRAEDMIVCHVTVEVQNELKEHLKRRWDQTSLTDDPAPDLSLVNALSTYSSHVSAVRVNLSSLVASRIYRRIVGHLSNHISQRAVYSGWSKFSTFGGQDFLHEIQDWVQTSSSAMLGSNQSTEDELLVSSAIEYPWQTLMDAGRLLSLPEDDGKGTATFAQAMAAAWSDGEESRVLFCQRAGTSQMGSQEMQGILRRRVECWR